MSKYEITAGGIYDNEGKEVPIGTMLTLKEEPTAWAGRYRVVDGGKAISAMLCEQGSVIDLLERDKLKVERVQ